MFVGESKKTDSEIDVEVGACVRETEKDIMCVCV
jgi:hypothetical protein